MNLQRIHRIAVKKFPKSVSKLSDVYFGGGGKRACNRIMVEKAVGFKAFLEVEFDTTIFKITPARLHTVLTGESNTVCAKAGCKSVTGYDVGKRKYKEFCSKVCANSSGAIKERREQTLLKKYGVVNPWQAEQVKKKIAKTNLERYGRENPSGAPEIIAKKRATSRKRFGTDHHMQSEEGKALQVAAVMERHGVTNGMHLESTKAKLRATNIDRYGAANPMQNQAIAEYCTKKSVAACMKKYGVTNAMLSPEVLAKWQESYGKRKKATFGKTEVYVQGYEKFALESLYAMKPFDRISTSIKHTRSVPYEFNGKQRRYVPDAKVRMLDGSIRVIEVKSWFTLRAASNIAKFKAATKFYNELGADFVLVIAEPELNQIRVIINPDEGIEALVAAAYLFSTGRRTW